jgi:hypothetical protein
MSQHKNGQLLQVEHEGHQQQSERQADQGEKFHTQPTGHNVPRFFLCTGVNAEVERQYAPLLPQPEQA